MTLGLIASVTPSSAAERDREVSGTIERVITEAPGFGQAHPGDPTHDHAADTGSSREDIYLITAAGEVIDVPPHLAEGLTTGTQVQA